MGCCTGSKYGEGKRSGFGVGSRNSSYGDGTGGGPKSEGVSNYISGGGGGREDSSFGGGSDEEPFCDPFLEPSELTPFGGEEWPRWLKTGGCGIISMLMHDEVKFGDEVKANNPDPDKKKIYTPENVKKITDCIIKCNKKSYPDHPSSDIRTGGGIQSYNHVIKCWMECKAELMESLGVNIDPSAFNIGYDKNANAMAMPKLGGGLCPPLCVGTEVVALMILIRRKWSCTWKRGPGGTSLCIPTQKLVRSGHIVRGKVACCTKGKEVCFDFEDYEPQTDAGGRFCIASYPATGKGTGRGSKGGRKGYGEIPKSAGARVTVLPEGGCMKNQSTWRGRYKPPCYEMVPGESYIFGLYIEDAPTDCPKPHRPCK